MKQFLVLLTLGVVLISVPYRVNADAVFTAAFPGGDRVCATFVLNETMTALTYSVTLVFADFVRE